MTKDKDTVLGAGERTFAGVMSAVWIGAGAYGIYRSADENALLLGFIGGLAIVYGLLWLKVMFKGKRGRIPLWF